jgi:hypothetical protein
MHERKMMKTKFALGVVILCSSFAVAVGQTVSVNYNQTQSYSQFHTYARGANNANKVQNSILAQVAVQDIDAALQGKGFQKVEESQKPDLLVTANGGKGADQLYRHGHARIWGWHGHHHTAAKCHRNVDRGSV